MTSSHSSASAWERVVTLGELEDDTVQARRSVPHRQRGEDTLPYEVQFVAERGAQQGRRWFVVERHERAQHVGRMVEVRLDDHRFGEIERAVVGVRHSVIGARARSTQRPERVHHGEPDLPIGVFDMPAQQRDRCRAGDLATDAHEQLLRATTVLAAA